MEDQQVRRQIRKFFDDKFSHLAPAHRRPELSDLIELHPDHQLRDAAALQAEHRPQEPGRCDADDRETRHEYSELILKQFDTLTSMQREVLEFARGESTLFVRRVFVKKFLSQIEEQLGPEHEVLLSGDHARVEAWRREQSRARRPSER